MFLFGRFRIQLFQPWEAATMESEFHIVGIISFVVDMCTFLALVWWNSILSSSKLWLAKLTTSERQAASINHTNTIYSSFSHSLLEIKQVKLRLPLIHHPSLHCFVVQFPNIKCQNSHQNRLALPDKGTVWRLYNMSLLSTGFSEQPVFMVITATTKYVFSLGLTRPSPSGDKWGALATRIHYLPRSRCVTLCRLLAYCWVRRGYAQAGELRPSSPAVAPTSPPHPRIPTTPNRPLARRRPALRQRQGKRPELPRRGISVRAERQPLPLQVSSGMTTPKTIG
jgi:hypothetical protein